MSRYKFGALGLWLALLFCLANVSALSVDVSEDVLLYPNQEFYLIMTLENKGVQTSVRIVGETDISDTHWNRSVLLLEDSGVKVGFVISAISGVGEYEINWSIYEEGEDPVLLKTKVLVSTMEETLGKVIGYYGFELDELGGYGDSIYIDDAKKNAEIARGLFDRGMLFEALKYTDFTRESLERAIGEGIIEEERPLKWLPNVRILSVFVGALLGVLLVIFILIRVFEKLQEFGYTTRSEGSSLSNKVSTSPKYVLDIGDMRKRVMRIRDVGTREGLLADLENAEEKFRLGLPMLGKAYLERIGRKIARGR